MSYWKTDELRCVLVRNCFSKPFKRLGMWLCSNLIDHPVAALDDSLADQRVADRGEAKRRPRSQFREKVLKQILRAFGVRC
jgi:hypothetical protein